MSQLLIAVDAVGVSYAAGPIVAGAVFYPPELDEPVFRYCNSKGAVIAGRFVTEGAIPEHLRPAVLSALRKQAEGWAVVSRPATVILPRGGQWAALEAMGMAVARLTERLKLSDHPVLEGVTQSSVSVLLRGGHQLPEHFVPRFINQVFHATDWRLDAARLLAEQRRLEEIHSLAIKYPRHGFDVHHGKLTAFHKRILRSYGRTPDHRR